MLKELALLITNNMRTSDCVARYGGEEFVIVMPFARLEDAWNKMEKLRKLIEKHPFLNGKIHITVSIGVSQYNSYMEIQDLLMEVDEKLYKAKREGRNRVIG